MNLKNLELNIEDLNSSELNEVKGGAYFIGAAYGTQNDPSFNNSGFLNQDAGGIVIADSSANLNEFGAFSSLSGQINDARNTPRAFFTAT